MSNTVVLQTRLSAQDRDQAEAILQNLGLSLTDAVRILVKQVIHQETLPFKLRISDDFYSKKNLQAIDQAVVRYEQGDYVEFNAMGIK